MKEVRGIEANNPTNIVEGPLTWRSFHRKCLGQTKNINKVINSASNLSIKFWGKSLLEETSLHQKISLAKQIEKFGTINKLTQ